MNEHKKSAYTEGLEAFVKGETLKMIPYPKLSENGISWMRGWHTAKYGQMMAGKI